MMQHLGIITDAACKREEKLARLIRPSIVQPSYTDDNPERIHKQLESFARAESKGGDVKVSKLEFVHLSPVSRPDSLGFQLIKQAAWETLRGPEVPRIFSLVAEKIFITETTNLAMSHSCLFTAGDLRLYRPQQSVSMHLAKYRSLRDSKGSSSTALTVPWAFNHYECSMV